MCTNVCLYSNSRNIQNCSCLRLSGCQLFLEAVFITLYLLQFLLRFCEALPRLTQHLHKLIALIEHVHHQLLKVRVVTRVDRITIARTVLRYRRHHVAHHLTQQAESRTPRYKQTRIFAWWNRLSESKKLQNSLTIGWLFHPSTKTAFRVRSHC